MTRYRATFAIVTIAVKDHSGSRSTPAIIVSGSPITGAQLSSSDQRP